MPEMPQDQVMTTDANPAPAGTSAATQSTTPPAPDNQKSWGDKYKHGTLHVIRNIIVNYIVNFGISAAGTYAVLNNKTLDKVFENFITRSVEAGNKVNMPEGLSRGLAKFFSRTQLLLCGGHVLLPFMKYTHDNRNKLEFSIGQKLDSLQETLGKGNAASKRNLAEYKYINDLMKAKTPTAQLTDDDKALLGKHNIGDNLQFSEHRQTWGHVLKARATGVAFTTTMGILFGLSGKLPKNYQMDEITKKAGKFLGEHGGLNKIPEKIISKPNELGEFAFLELLYTAGSKLGFDHAEKRQMRKQEEAEKAAANAQLAQDRSQLPASGNAAAKGGFASRTVSATDTRRKIVDNGEQDFRTREAAKPGDISPAMS